MPAGLRRLLAVLLTLVLFTTAFGSTATASSVSTAEQASAPVTFDVLVLRPVGFFTLVLGSGLFVASLPLIAITRPMDIGKPFNHLVVAPAKFLWMDPLGSH